MERNLKKPYAIKKERKKEMLCFHVVQLYTYIYAVAYSGFSFRISYNSTAENSLAL